MKDIIKKLCSMPVAGEWIALIIGLIAPLIPFVLLFDRIGISEEVIMIFGGLAISGWNYFLKRSDTVSIVTPVIPIPVWIFGIIIALVSLGYVITGNQFS